MHIGTFIKYCRLFKGLTQKEVSNGICTPAHMSRMESGENFITKEMILKVGIKLNMDIERMHRSFKKWQMDLELWHDFMCKDVTGEIESLKETIENNQLLQIETINGTYKLLKARYYIKKGNLWEATSYLNQFMNIRNSFYMSSYDYQLYYHIKGMLELSKGHSMKAIELLESIDETKYTNKEFYLHLAYAYHECSETKKSIQCIETAMNYFKVTYNFSGMMDGSIFLLKAEGRKGSRSMTVLEEKYEKLIHRCHHLHDDRRNAILHINLGNEYLIDQDYKRAIDTYSIACQLLKERPDSIDYLVSIIGLVRSSILLNENGDKTRNLDLLTKGIKFAETIRDTYRYTLLNMLKKRLKDGEYAYMQYIEKILIPLLIREGRYSECHKYMNEVSLYKKNNSCLIQHPDMAVY
jgi:HTH-type transcriptional regulator, quorum sensing regulator NprR